jgi:hypothetical protein
MVIGVLKEPSASIIRHFYLEDGGSKYNVISLETLI